MRPCLLIFDFGASVRRRKDENKETSRRRIQIGVRKFASRHRFAVWSTKILFYILNIVQYCRYRRCFGICFTTTHRYLVYASNMSLPSLAFSGRVGYIWPSCHHSLSVVTLPPGHHPLTWTADKLLEVKAKQRSAGSIGARNFFISEILV